MNFFLKLMKKQSLTKQAVYEAITNSNDTSFPTVRYNLFFFKQQSSYDSFEIFYTVS